MSTEALVEALVPPFAREVEVELIEPAHGAFTAVAAPAGSIVIRWEPPGPSST